ncbi:MAG: DUF2723 domain-containing protein [Deltaproteobacteria bacterium]|nr:DUF2723 domain-containing protein [Deltaproteobacteria bacterium]
MPASSEPERPFPTAALFATLAVFFTATASSTTGWRDAGEIGAAAFHLGIAHPTGFPLALVASKAVALLLPLGDAALRMSIASGLAMAGAATLSARLAAGIVGGWSAPSMAAACLVAVGFISSPTLLWFGTSIEAYSWAALVISAALFAAFRAATSGDPRPALVVFLLAGLALGCHASAVIACSIAAAAALAGVAGHRVRTALLGLAAAAAGALVIAYLPLRSLAGAHVMWDDLSTPGSLAAHLSAARIREAFAGRAGGPALGWDAITLARLLAQDLGAVGFVLAPAGALLAWRRSRTGSWMLGGTAAAGLLYALLVNPMGIADRQTGFLATIACLVLAGVALGEGVIKVLVSRGWMAPVLGVALIAAAPFLRPADTCRIAHDDLPVTWAGAALSRLPPRALVLCTSDEMCGLGLYLEAVEGRRPDVGIVPRQHLWNDDALVQALGRSHGSASREALAAGRGVGPRLARLAASREHAVYWEVGSGKDLPLAFGQGRPPLDYGPGASPPLARVGPGDPGPDVEHALGARLVRWLTLVGHDPKRLRMCDLNFMARRMLARDFLGVGLVLAWQGKMDKSYASFERAVIIKPDYAPALVNLAILEAEAGRIERGIAFARRAVHADPMRQKARAVLGRLLIASGRIVEGREVLEPLKREAGP